MRQLVTWLLVAIGITVASIAVFVLAAALFPGEPGSFYLFVSLILLSAALGFRLLSRR